MSKVVILGASGMLGGALADFFSRSCEFDVSATVRGRVMHGLQALHPTLAFRQFDAERCSVDDILSVTRGAQWVINAIGVIKQRIVDHDQAIVARAIRVNALFPVVLAQAAGVGGFRVIQIATDCVYSGDAEGGYVETAAHDCWDVYGRSKSLGEVQHPQVYNLRCSIVGLERRSALSLLNWFLSQAPDARVNGFTNHIWNGITALHFAKICFGLMTADLRIPKVQHIVPMNTVSKCDLLRSFAAAFGREDITIVPGVGEASINRSLGTNDPEANRALWTAAGYADRPSIAEMVAELALNGMRNIPSQGITTRK